MTALNETPLLFICHASDDKEVIVDPFVNRLRQYKIDVWYDKISLSIGDKINDKIHEGLQKSRYGVVFLSPNFLNVDKEYTWTELGGLIYKMNKEGSFLFPLYYKIDPDRARIKPLGEIRGEIIHLGNVDVVAGIIYKKIEEVKQFEKKEKERTRKKKQQKRTKEILLVVSVLFLFFFVIFNEYRSELTTPPKKLESSRDSLIHKAMIPTNSKESENKKPHQKNTRGQNESGIKEDYNSYVNSSILNSDENIDVSITIIDSKKNSIDLSISSVIADVYAREGKRGTTGLFKSTFIKRREFQELFEGNTDVIEKFKLGHHISYLAIGKLNYSLEHGSLINGTFVCNASIEMSIIKLTTKSAYHFTINENGNGATEAQARENAKQKLMNRYFTEHSSLL